MSESALPMQNPNRTIRNATNDAGDTFAGSANAHVGESDATRAADAEPRTAAADARHGIGISDGDDSRRPDETDAPSTEGPTAHDAALAIRARAFTFAYPASVTSTAPDVAPPRENAIGPIDWDVPQGAFQLLVGTTGSGKTTLLRNCKSAIAPHGNTSGTLEIFGIPAKDLTAQQSATLVGYVAQSPENQIVCDTVWHEIAFGLENLGTPQSEMRRRVAEVAHFFGIEPWFRRQISELSGGQKQIVTLAGILAMKPRILLLDEPTSQLDPVAEKTFLHALFRVNRELGITVVVATHAPEAMADYATDAVRMEQGSLRRVSVDHFTVKPLDATVLRRAQQLNSSPTGTSLPCIALNDAYYRYDKSSDWVLRGLDLEVFPGTIHALVGGNGCGKSTLLKVIAGVAPLERGRVENSLAQSQALLPQNPKALFVCDSVEEELCEWQQACGYSDADVKRIAAQFDLASRMAHHPYDLSGGQQQLLAFAKLLLTRPKLLLLDEPTKGLDSRTKESVARALLALARNGATIIMATHDLPFAALISNSSTMLFDGENAATQPSADFFADNLFYRPVNDAFARNWASRQDGAQ